MIEFRIFPEFGRGEMKNLGKCWKNVKVIPGVPKSYTFVRKSQEKLIHWQV